MEIDIGYVRSGIEDLAFMIRHSREPGNAGIRVCIEHRSVLTKTSQEKQYTMRVFTGTML